MKSQPTIFGYTIHTDQTLNLVVAAFPEQKFLVNQFVKDVQANRHLYPQKIIKSFIPGYTPRILNSL